MGQRVQKTVNGITTTYLRDASGNVMATYSGSSVEHTIYGSSRLGIYKGGRETGQRKTGLKNYELSNHLGNVLAVISDKKVLVSDYFIADVVSATDYYPFGYAMPKREYQSSGYRYGFNGKENDTEIGWQDYGERMYAPKICRFPSADLLIIYGQQYPELSSYQFASNTPIQAIDLDGLEMFIPRLIPLIDPILTIPKPIVTPLRPGGSILLPPIAPIIPYEHTIGQPMIHRINDIDWSDINGRPSSPEELGDEWTEVTSPKNDTGNYRVFKNKKTGEKIQFDEGKDGANGWEAINHWHRHNPNSTGKADKYLDKDGNSTPKGSNPSH